MMELLALPPELLAMVAFFLEEDSISFLPFSMVCTFTAQYFTKPPKQTLQLAYVCAMRGYTSLLQWLLATFPVPLMLDQLDKSFVRFGSSLAGYALGGGFLEMFDYIKENYEIRIYQDYSFWDSFGAVANIASLANVAAMLVLPLLAHRQFFISQFTKLGFKFQNWGSQAR